MAAPVKAIVLSLAIGGVVGFGAGVVAVKAGRDLFVGMFASERAATVATPTTVDRPSFVFQHAGNWRVDATDKDYDADHSFSVETPGQSFVMFQIAEGDLEPKAVVETHAALQMAKVIKQATRTSFTKWGAYTGEGALLTGKHLGLTPGTVRIFAFRVGERTYTVVESTYDDDRANVEPGFRLIERSFRVKGAR